jgi:hypothetical protein
VAAISWSPVRAATFGDDAAFLRQNTNIVILSDASGAEVALAPAWQGRVMTSTAQGDAGWSFGWINRDLIASGKLQPHINAFGGEERFWLGPEGGQFGIYFPKGAKFDLEHWYVPAALDTEPFELVSRSRERALFHAKFAVANWSGTRFEGTVQRSVQLIDRKQAWATLNLPPSRKVSLVAYESVNTLTNAGRGPWEKRTGLLSIWLLGMFNPSPTATIVVPLKPQPQHGLADGVTSDYFGEIPANRFEVTRHAVFFSGDGQFRSKIGINPMRATGKLGSYDADHHVLTLVIFDQPAGAADYVNSLWKLQDEPYRGDAANSYNDGAPSPGAKPLGPFYELESSSPAAELAPGASLTHTRKTIHLTGPEGELNAVAHKVLGVSIAEIRSALKSP